jgi:hypothetical protein
LLIRQGHLIWIVSILNVGLGFFVPGFNPYAQPISAVGLEAPAFAYTHRGADIIIGLSMCLFGLGLFLWSSRKTLVSLVLIVLLGASFISAGIWTMQSRLHLLYNLSIVVILVPVVAALELKPLISSRQFEAISIIASLVHVLMFWCILAGFIPSEIDGLVQRLWTVVVMGWFGIAAHMVWSEPAPR